MCADDNTIIVRPMNPDLLEHLMTIIRIDRTPKRIRARLGDTFIADSTDARLAYAAGRHPQYLLPAADVEWDSLATSDGQLHDEFGAYHDVRLSGAAGGIGRRYVDGPADGFVQFDFDALDSWFEEDEQIWFHARDPHRRVDVTESSRHVLITVNGVTVAETDRPRLVTETGLPERWYVPRADVDWAKLIESNTTSGCQYKGIANWWHVDVGDGDVLADVVWGYERPIPEASKLSGLVAFYAEHAAVETIVGDTIQPKPEFDPSWLNPSLHLDNQPVAVG